MEKSKKKEKKSKSKFWDKVGNVVRKAVDCCLE